MSTWTLLAPNQLRVINQTSTILVGSKIAATALSGHRAVTLDSIGKLNYASNDNYVHSFKLLGMTTGAVAEGALATVLFAGELTEPSWNWNINLPIFLGANGLLTQIVPQAPSAMFILEVAWPVTPTLIYWKIGTPILTI